MNADVAGKTILTCAVTGNLMSRANSPHLPVTPSEIAASALEAAAAGAAVLHLHVRDPATGKGSMEPALYRELVERIRERNEDVILNLTTGEGGRFVPSTDDPRNAADGSTLCAPERRVAHVVSLKPEIATLDLNTMWSGQAAVINPPRNVGIMADAIYRAGSRPEIEVFDSGDIQLMRALLGDGVLKAPLMVQMVLGVRYGAIPTPDTVMYLRSLLPAGTIWAAFGIGRAAFPMLAQAFLLGGHVRIGMEDTAYIGKGEHCRSNAQLVEKAARIVGELGGELATPAEARGIMGIGQ
jgi:3-dehydrocarnitine:acetyl-CoA trimethylamine transferase